MEYYSIPDIHWEIQTKIGAKLLLPWASVTLRDFVGDY